MRTLNSTTAIATAFAFLIGVTAAPAAFAGEQQKSGTDQYSGTQTGMGKSGAQPNQDTNTGHQSDAVGSGKDQYSGTQTGMGKSGAQPNQDTRTGTQSGDADKGKDPYAGTHTGMGKSGAQPQQDR